MRYVMACLEDEKHEKAYRIYVTEALRGIPQGKYSRKSFCDIIDEIEDENVAKSGDEIVAEVMRKAGLSFG